MSALGIRGDAGARARIQRTSALTHSRTSLLSLILFDDEASARWEPFALTRPGGELVLGTMTLRARAERVFGARCMAHLGAGHLRGFEEAGAPPVLGYAEAPSDGDRLFLAARAVPAWGSGETWTGKGGGAGRC